MPEIAMYYPYIHVQDDRWLKVAALYWPRLARLTPTGYPKSDSAIAKVLDTELGFFLNLEPPHRQVRIVADEFIDFVHENQERLRARYGPNVTGINRPSWHWELMNTGKPGDARRQRDYIDDYFNGIHFERTTLSMRRQLIEWGLAVDDDKRGSWLRTHPAISNVYVIALIDRIADDNNITVVTDQEQLHEIHRRSARETLMGMLLEDPPSVGPRHVDDIATMYATIAIQAVVPANLEKVPIHKIVKARQKLAAEFDVFREHLNNMASEFASFTGVDNPTILQAQLQLLVERDLRRPTAVLERNLRQLGLEPARAVLGLKTIELPAIATTATSALGVPLVAGQAGLVAARLLTGRLQSRSQQRAAMQSGPAGYLLGLKKQFRPSGLVQRVHSVLRRASSSE